MKTHDFISMLARAEAAAAPNAVRRRFQMALAWGAFGAALLLLLTLGVRPDLLDAIRLPMFWIKLVFVAAVAAAGLMLAVRLSRPGSKLGLSPLALAVPFVAIWALAAVVLAGSPGERSDLILGATWYFCPIVISLLALPTFIAAIWAMKGLAPTNLRLAGAAAGVFAAGVGAALYSFHCTEMAAPFLAVWYVVGIAVPAVTGALLGPGLLRW